MSSTGTATIIGVVVFVIVVVLSIIGRRRNMDETLGESQQWFPVCAWDKYEKKQLNDLMIVCSIEEGDQKVVERMVKVALCCVQYKPENRPVMSIVVKMLEGALEIPEPLNPFSHLFPGVDGVDNNTLANVGNAIIA
ncbi:hypothetical protein L1987_77676 [Smallanthus sonchifolius]|uniref:Uncharacterized protein n=1 Tax=Smallanthus sonchifolius TaxID=185202 RepID=A0ACB8ZAT0_9ASTR|nr:hypothetical protein L1987_77676 [Smallanthus sonchifolius]